MLRRFAAWLMEFFPHDPKTCGYCNRALFLTADTDWSE